MTATQIKTLCDKIGVVKDPSSKSIKYIDLNNYDLHSKYLSNKIELDEENNILAVSDFYGNECINDIIDLDHVHAISVAVNSREIIDIYDVVNKLSDTPVDYPVLVKFDCNGTIVKPNTHVTHEYGSPLNVKILMNRNVPEDSYTITKTDHDGNPVSSFDERGTYELKIKFSNGFIGIYSITIFIK